MNQILRFLFENPILILILVGWLFSVLAGAAGKAAKRAPRQRPEFDKVRERQRREAAAQRAERQATGPRSSDEIAQQLREMLGLERAPQPVAQPAPVVDEERPRYVERDTDEPVVVTTVAAGDLAKELVRRRTEQKKLSDVADQHVGGLLEHHIAAPSRRFGRRLAFDRRRAAAAVMGAEILGPPRSLRPWQSGAD